MQLRNLLFHRSDFFLAFLDHAVIALRVGFVPNPLHQNCLHFVLQPENTLFQLCNLYAGQLCLWRPVRDQMLQRIPVLLIQHLGIFEFVHDQPVQYGLVDLVLRAVFLAIAVVGAANIDDPFSVF